MSHWKLEIYDHAGNVTGIAAQPLNGPLTVIGDPDTLVHVLPEIARIPIFLTDPEYAARAAYQVYCEHFPTPSGRLTWDQLRTEYPLIHQRWLAIGTAATRAKPDHN